MVKRTISDHVIKLFSQFPVVTITGPRQSGKTTLARSCFSELPYVNLEHPETRMFASEDPVKFMAKYKNGAVIDEIQRVPQLSSYIQVLVDEKQTNGMFVLTGSQQFNMLETVSQSLAGRTVIIKLLPFSVSEIIEGYPEFDAETDNFIFHGFYPRIFEQKIDPVTGYAGYIETYIERDLRQLTRIQDLGLFQRFLKLCAGRVGQLLNYSNLANDVGISHKAASEWITLLEASFIVYKLPPYYRNISKRLMKSSKLYFYDTGLASRLLGIDESYQIETHPLRGALFENLVVSEIMKSSFNNAKPSNLYFFRDAKGHEVDLLYQKADKNIAIEIKSSGTVRDDFFKGLDYFNNNIETAEKKILIYDGERNEERSRAIVTNIHKVQDWLR